MRDTIYRCEICGDETQHPTKWFIIHCAAEFLTVFRWSTEKADVQGARHYCGEAHAQVYISRWFQTQCG